MIEYKLKDKIEIFLKKFEDNEKEAFLHHDDYILIPIIPFFQMVHLLNKEEVIDFLFKIELEVNGMLLRLDGQIVIACEESQGIKDKLHRLITLLLELMRF